MNACPQAILPEPAIPAIGILPERRFFWNQSFSFPVVAERNAPGAARVRDRRIGKLATFPFLKTRGQGGEGGSSGFVGRVQSS